MQENIYKFLKRRKKANFIKECDMSTEIKVTVNEIEKKHSIDFYKDTSKAHKRTEDNNKVLDKIVDDCKVEIKNVVDVIVDNKKCNSIAVDDCKVEIKNVNDVIVDNKECNTMAREVETVQDLIDSPSSSPLPTFQSIASQSIASQSIASQSIASQSIASQSIASQSITLRDRVLSFVPVPALKVPSIDKHYKLPKHYLRLIKIFRVMTTIQNYNENRGLTCIFKKCQKCIEDVLKIRVNISDIERIRRLGDLEIKVIEVDGEKTFTYKIKNTIEDFENKVWEYYKENGEEEVEKKIIFENSLLNESKKDIKKVNEIINKDNKKVNEIINKDNKKVNEIINKDNKKVNEIINKDSKKSYANILERLKEKERLRKVNFIKKEEDNSVFLKRLDMYFKKEDKQSVKIKEIIKVFNLYDGDKYLRKLVEKEKDLYEIKEIFGEEYIIKLIN